MQLQADGRPAVDGARRQEARFANRGAGWLPHMNAQRMLLPILRQRGAEAQRVKAASGPGLQTVRDPLERGSVRVGQELPAGAIGDLRQHALALAQATAVAERDDLDMPLLGGTRRLVRARHVAPNDARPVDAVAQHQHIRRPAALPGVIGGGVDGGDDRIVQVGLAGPGVQPGDAAARVLRVAAERRHCQLLLWPAGGAAWQEDRQAAARVENLPGERARIGAEGVDIPADQRAGVGHQRDTERRREFVARRDGDPLARNARLREIDREGARVQPGDPVAIDVAHQHRRLDNRGARRIHRQHLDRGDRTGGPGGPQRHRGEGDRRRQEQQANSPSHDNPPPARSGVADRPDESPGQAGGARCRSPARRRARSRSASRRPPGSIHRRRT